MPPLSNSNDEFRTEISSRFTKNIFLTITERSIKLLSNVMLISTNRIKVLRLWLDMFWRLTNRDFNIRLVPRWPDTTFDSLKRVHLNPKSASATSRNPLQSCLVFHLILDLLQKTCFWANFDSSYDIMLSYLVKNSIQRDKNRRGEKRVSAGWEKSLSFTKITKEMNQ